MKNYSTMNTMQCFSSTNSLSNSSKDSKQMFLTTRREPLIPPSTYQHHLNLQNQTVNYSNHPPSQQSQQQQQQQLQQQQQQLQQQQQSQNFSYVHPHHTVLSSSCSPSISSNSINIWATINNSGGGSSGVKQNDKVPHYSALTTLGRLNNNHTLHPLNSLHNKYDESHKDVRWRTTNERRFCFLLLVIGWILTFILLIFSLIFYFIVYNKSVSFGIDVHNSTSTSSSSTSSNSNLVNSGFKLANNFNVNLKHSVADIASGTTTTSTFTSDRIKQQQRLQTE